MGEKPVFVQFAPIKPSTRKHMADLHGLGDARFFADNERLLSKIVRLDPLPAPSRSSWLAFGSLTKADSLVHSGVSQMVGAFVSFRFL